MKSLEKKIIPIWILQLTIISLVISTGVGYLARNISPFIGLILFTFLIALSTIYSILKYKRWGYELREDYLYLEHGVIWKITSMVPYVRIQHVDTQRGAIDRLIGLSNVVVYTAGSRGADVHIPGLMKNNADDMQVKLREVAIETGEDYGDAV